MTKGPIIVPLDGSTTAENALPLARIFAEQLDADVRIVRVADPDESSRLDDLTEANDAFVKYAMQRAEETGFETARVSARLLSGPPAPTLLEEAHHHEATAIVLASHGRSGFKATVVGSVADKVVRGSNVPVLVVPGVGEAPTAITHVLVPLDGSEASERALPLARQIADGVKARLTLMQAFTVIPPQAAAFEYYVPEAAEGAEDAAQEYLKQKRREGEGAVVAQGDAATAIVSAAESTGADLVAMGTSGKGLAGRLFLGSTTDRVLHSLHRPMLIVRPEIDDRG